MTRSHFIEILMILTKYVFDLGVRLTEFSVTVESVTLRFYCIYGQTRLHYPAQKIIIKKRTTKKEIVNAHALLLDHFYLLISLEGMSTFIRSWASFENQIWDVHLYNL